MATTFLPSRADRRRKDLAYREQLRIVLLFLAVPATLGLALLVANGEPLPLPDLRISALTTVVFCLVAIALVLYVHKLHLLSFPSLFLAVTFLFTCSPLILYLLQGERAFRLWEVVDYPAVLAAMPVIMLAFSSFLLGAVLIHVRLPADAPAATEEEGRPPSPSATTRVLRGVGFGLYGVGFLFVAYSTISGGTLSYALSGGYAAYHEAKRSGAIVGFVGVFMAHLLPWSLLILTATARDRRSRALVLVLAAPFVLVMLAVGDRGGPIATMAIVASGLYLVGARIGLGKSLAVGLLIAFLIPTILNLRQLPISEWTGTAIGSAATNQVDVTNTYGEGPITGFFTSMSSPYQTLMATVAQVPQHEDYHHGSDYLSSMVVAIPFRSVLFPFFGAEVNRLPPSQWVLLLLHPGRNAGPGYLQVAEGYLQFGAVGVIGLYLLFGWLLIRLWGAMTRRVHDPRVLAFTLIVMMETLLWVRNSSSSVVRAIAWGAVLVFVVPAVLTVRRWRRSEQPTPPGPITVLHR
ncbi:MAG TPA: O-antigen polymerase [Actinomycetota bacterium]|jgi:hypothetical protein|nr:O-antigen polymerase [Actinomycetota bacterium]